MSREAIIDVINLYSGALDSWSLDLFDLIFTEDAEADYPPTEWHWTDRATFKKDFEEFHTQLGGHQHILTNHQVLIRGDEAWALTYGKYSLFESAEKGGRMNEGGCWYDDYLVRTEVGWRIRKRVARVFWMRTATPAGEAIPEAVRLDSFPEEVRAGRVEFINALRRHG